MLPIKPSRFRHTKITTQQKIITSAILSVVLISLLFAAPFLFWVYHIQMAGWLLETAMDWSEVRQVDTLPQLQNEQQAEEALAHLHDAIYWQPNNIYAYRLVAYVYMAQKESDQAIEMINQAQALASTHRLLLWEEALAYEQLWHNTQETSQNAAVISQQQKRLLQLWTQLDLNGEKFTRRGYEAREKARYEEALKWYARAELMGAELESGIIYTRYIAQLDPEEETLGAINLLEDAITLDRGWSHPDERFRAWSQWGQVLFQQAKYAEAEAVLLNISEGFVAQKSDLQRTIAENYRLLALAQIQQEKPDTALQSLQKAIEKDRKNAWAYVNYGQLLYELDPTRVAETKDAFNNALFLEPENEELWQGVIIFWRRMRQRDEAQLLCEAAEPEALALAIAEICQNNSDGELSSDWYFEYLALSEQGDQKGAREALQQAIELDEGWFNPTDRYRAWLSWGRLLFELEEYEKASVVLQKVVDDLFIKDRGLEPFQSESLRFLALTQIQQAEQEAALQHLEEAIELDAENLWAYVTYGQLLYELDPTQSAQTAQAFEKALTLQSADLKLWENLILFWRREREIEQAETMCQVANQQGMATDKIKACQVSNGTSASSDWYYEYEALLAENNEVEAFDALQKAVELDEAWFVAGERFRAWYKWGRFLFENEQYREAEKILQHTTNLPTEGIPASLLSQSYRFLALAQIELGQEQAALSNLEEAIELYDQDIWPYIHYGQLLYQLDPTQRTKTAEAFDTAFELEPNNAQLWQNVILFWRRNGQKQEAQRLCQNAAQTIATEVADVCQGVDGSETSSDRYFEYQTFSAEGKQQQAQEALQRAIELDEGWFTPVDRFRAWSAWGRLLFELKQYDEAQVTLQKAIEEIYPGGLEEIKSESLRILALAQVELGQPEEALQNLQDAIESNKQNLWALVRYGQLLYELDPSRVIESRQRFEDALRLQPDNVELSRNLILFLRRHLEIEQVRVLCEVASEQNGATKIAEVCQATDGTEISGDKYFEYQALSAKGEQEEAAKALEQAIELDEGWFSSQDRFRAWYQRGRWLVEQTQSEEAERVLKQAVELYPEEGGETAILADVYRFLALSQGYQGRQEDALENLRLSLEYNEKNVWSHLQYGQTWFLLNPESTTEASDAFAKALSLQDTANIWRNVIGFWVRFDEPEQIAALCEQVAEKEFAEQLEDLCQ